MAKHYRAIVMGGSAGGPEALRTVLTALPGDFPVPILVVQHLSPDSENYMVRYLDKVCAIAVKEADEKEMARPGTVYVAPPNYHLMAEADGTLSLSVAEKVSYARPSVDVLFETAADAYGPDLVGIILTGANRDGSRGIRQIKENGGLTVVQSPDTAVAAEMPSAAMAAIRPDHVLPLSEIGEFLCMLFRSHHG